MIDQDIFAAVVFIVSLAICYSIASKYAEKKGKKGLAPIIHGFIFFLSSLIYVLLVNILYPTPKDLASMLGGFSSTIIYGLVAWGVAVIVKKIKKKKEAT